MKLQDNEENHFYSNNGHYDTKPNSNTYNRLSSSNNEYGKIRPSSQWNKNKTLKISLSKDKNGQRPGFPAIYTSSSFRNTANLYLNPKNFTYSLKHKPKQHINEYYEKEQLFDRVMKLQTELNTLKQKYTKQMIENDKNMKEIKKQNKYINSLNFQNFKEEETKNYYTAMEKSDNNQSEKRPSQVSEKYQKMDRNKYILSEDMKREEIREKFRELISECELRDEKIINLQKDNENIVKDNEKLI